MFPNARTLKQFMKYFANYFTLASVFPRPTKAPALSGRGLFSLTVKLELMVRRLKRRKFDDALSN